MTPLVIGIDPGTKQSAYVAWDGQWIQELGTEPNPQVAKYLRDVGRRTGRDTCVVFEAIESYGMPIGKETLETVFWTGRLFQIARDTIGPKQVSRLPRRAVKKHLKLGKGSGDPQVRAALIRRYRHPNDWRGLKSHQWAAFALAVCWWETERARQPLKGQVITA
jgi:hypothetical protein